MVGRSRGGLKVAVLAGAVAVLLVVLAFMPSPLGSSLNVPPDEPAATSSFLFGAAGDYGGTGNADTLGLLRRLNAAGADFLLALGDLGYANDEQAWCSFVKGAFNDVLVIAGNHDTGESSGGQITEYAQYCPFTLPVTLTGGPGTPGYGVEYYFDYPATTPLARVIMITPGVRGSLSYDYSPGSSHFNWVVSSINGARTAGIPWVFVGMHKQCIVSGDKTSCEIGQGLFDKLVELKVDFILQAHAHIYERSHSLGLSPSCPTVPSAGQFDGDCIADDGFDDFHGKGNGSVVMILGTGGTSVRSVTLSNTSDRERDYFVELMGSNANTQGLSWGFGSTRFNVSAEKVVLNTDFCPPGTSDSSGQCPSRQLTVFKDGIQVGGTPPPPPPPPPVLAIPVNAFRGEYYDNQDFTNLKVRRIDASVNFNWGTGTPDTSLQSESFTVRWEGYWDFAAAGTYRFSATMDDGMRVWVDNASVIDGWIPQPATLYTKDVSLSAGRHYVKVDYFEQSGNAVAQVSWAYVGPPAVPLPTAAFTRSPTYPKPGDTITFDASTSTSLNGSLSARWDWTNDGTWDTSWSGTLTAQHAYTSGGTYTVRLEVQDAAGYTDNETQSVLVDGTAPVTSAALSGTAGGEGWYRSAVTVTLTATDAGSGVGSTQYRKDGGAWTAYASAVSVSGDGPHTLEFASTDRAGNAEVTKSVSIPIDTTAPATTHLLDGVLGNGTWYASPVTITLLPTDGGSGVSATRYRLDGGTWQTYTIPVPVTTNGSHSFDYYSADGAGNTESTKSAPFQIGSSSGPVSTAAVSGTGGANGWYVSPATVTLSATDPEGRPVTITYRIDGGSWTTYSAPFAVGEGAHTLEHYATNDQGLVEPTRSASVNVDATPPTTTHAFAGTQSGSDYVGSVDLTLTATDATSGVASTRYRLDGGSWTAYTTGPLTITQTGAHTLEYDSTDAAGNVEATHSASFTIQSAVTAPVSTLQLAGDQAASGWYTSEVTVTLTATGSGALSIRVRVDAGTWTDYGGPITIGEGRHALGYYAVDGGGTAEPIRVASIDVDMTPPAFERLAPTGILVAPTVDLSWAASDGGSGVVGYEVSVDGAAFVPVGNVTTYQLVLPDGEHYVALKAVDEAGNVQIRAVTFRVDTSPLSPTGPYSGIPLFLLMELIATVAVLGLLARGKRKRLRRYREFTERQAQAEDPDAEEPWEAESRRPGRSLRRP
jgi:hypothetical protein